MTADILIPAPCDRKATLALPGTGVFRLTDAFLADKSDYTKRDYAGDLQRFAAFYDHPDIETACQAFIRLGNGAANACLLSWKAAQLEAGLTPATINRRLACLRSLVKRARQLGLTSLAVDVEGLRRQAYRDTRGPGLKHATAMLRLVESRPGARGPRDFAILALAIDCGLRRSEILGLDLEHVEPDGLWIKGKARHQRERITLPEPTVAALARWLECRGSEPGPLFYAIHRNGTFGGRLSGSALYGLVSRVARKLGFHTSPHRLRHTAISTALDQTQGDVRGVRLYSRHKDVATVLIYDDARGDRGGSVAKLVAAAVRHELAAISSP